MSENEAKCPVVFLAGERLYLRPAEMEDVPNFQRWINDPETRRTLIVNRPINEPAERQYVESLSDDHGPMALVIVLRDADRAIGTIDLHEIDWTSRRASLGIMVGKADCRGKGYGSEAIRLMLGYGFETLNLHRIQLDVFEFNEAGIRCYERIGFVKEGVLREHLFREGRYHDVLRYGMLAREYFESKTVQARTSAE